MSQYRWLSNEGLANLNCSRLLQLKNMLTARHQAWPRGQQPLGAQQPRLALRQRLRWKLHQSGDSRCLWQGGGGQLDRQGGTRQGCRRCCQGHSGGCRCINRGGVGRCRGRGHIGRGWHCSGGKGARQVGCVIGGGVDGVGRDLLLLDVGV